MDDDKIIALEVAVARIETKIDTILGQHNDRLLDHETRLRGLEKARWWIAGAAGVLGAAGAQLAQFLPG